MKNHDAISTHVMVSLDEVLEQATWFVGEFVGWEPIVHRLSVQKPPFDVISGENDRMAIYNSSSGTRLIYSLLGYLMELDI